MAKFYGEIGFAELVTDDLGVTKEHITKAMYTGDLLRNNRRLENSGQVNDDLNISNEISIIGDPYAYQNFHTIRYVKFMNAKWKVISVDVQYPRLILSLGGVYHGEDES